jgi:hypothetical protein
MNGNIFNHPPTSKQYNWGSYSAYATPPNPPTSTNTTTGKPLPAQSHINAYNTSFNQETSSFSGNYQRALLSRNLSEYGLPTALDLHEIEVNIVPTPFPVTPGGVKGIGEIPVVVYSAT